MALFYNWLKIEDNLHSWVTELVKDYAVPVNFLGLSTEDRRHVYPQKEVPHMLSTSSLVDAAEAAMRRLRLSVVARAACEKMP